MIGILLGGFALGMLDKAGTKVPTVPLLGRAGSLGVGGHFVAKHLHSPLLANMSKGFLAIASYEMGRDGHIAGADVDGFLSEA